ncbi:hypothetical protein BST61_g4505 [Cercospora zeina]
MKALPIFSHGDGGINKIPRERQYEYSCISQVGSDSAPAKHPADLSTLFFVSDSPDFKLRLTSTVHLLADKAIKYDQPITMVGHLTGQSLGILKHQIAAAATTADGRYGRLTEKVVLRLLENWISDSRDTAVFNVRERWGVVLRCREAKSRLPMAERIRSWRRSKWTSDQTKAPDRP